MTAEIKEPEVQTLEARTYELVKWLVNEKNEQLISLLEKLRTEQKIREYRASLKPMSEEELLARAEASEEAIRKGETIDVEDLLIELGEEIPK